MEKDAVIIQREGNIKGVCVWWELNKERMSIEYEIIIATLLLAILTHFEGKPLS